MGYSREQVMKAGKTAGRATAADGADPAQVKRAAAQTRRGRYHAQEKKRVCAPTVNHDDALDVIVEGSVRWQFGRRLTRLYFKGQGEDRWSVSGHRQVEYCGEHIAFQVGTPFAQKAYSGAKRSASVDEVRRSGLGRIRPAR